jgi:putative endonuclease
MSYYVYIMASRINGTIYIGSTSDLPQRVDQHKSKLLPKCFTAKHNVTLLVYFEECDSAEAMVQRERSLKEWNRAWKIRLIRYSNPNWDDLAYKL